MKERPILFSGDMVRAILEGRKTQTRRVVKLNVKTKFVCLDDREGDEPCFVDKSGYCPVSDNLHLCPFGTVGDRLWLRETWRVRGGREYEYQHHQPSVVYRADADASSFVCDEWTPSIHMPRWASRITLEITGVRVERLQDITEEDAKAEGIQKMPNPWNDIFWKAYTKVPTESGDGEVIGFYEPIKSFQTLWKSIYGHESWDANPWVWVVEFKKL